MSAHSSDSESTLKKKGWTVVDNSGDVESDASSSQSSLEFVKLEGDTVSFHHKDQDDDLVTEPDLDSTAVSKSGEKEETLSGDERRPSREGSPDSDEDASSSSIEKIDLDELSAEQACDEEIAAVQACFDEEEDEEEEKEEEEEEDLEDLEDLTDDEKESQSIEDFFNQPSTSSGVRDMMHGRVPGELSHSDSDSDFVRLDPIMAEDVNTHRDPLRHSVLAETARQHLMSSSSSSMDSSISSGFRFIHPALFRQRNLQRPFLQDDDNESVPEDVDDRCESDISGIAGDESDLSSMVYNIGDLPLTAGTRLYRHRPNNRLNSLLSYVTLMVFFVTIGVGIGHYLGSTRENGLRMQHVARMKTLQDDYLMCLRHQDILELKIQQPSDTERKHTVVLNLWKQKYEELLMEKAEIEHKVTDLEEEETAKMADLERRHQMELLTRVREMEILESERSAELEKQHLEAEQTMLAEHQQELTDLQEEGRVRERQLMAKVSELENRLEESQQSQTELQVIADDLSTLQNQNQVKNEETTTELREQMNQLQTENQDLKAEIMRLRYSAHPANDEVNANVVQENLKVKVNTLATENDDLKSVVGKMRYTDYPGNTDEEDLIISTEVPNPTPGVTSKRKDHHQEDPLEPHTSEKLSSREVAEDPLEPHTFYIISPEEHQLNDDLEEEEPVLVAPVLPSDAGKSQHASDDETSVPSGDEISDLEKMHDRLVAVDHELALERDRSKLWQTMFVAERTAHEMDKEKQQMPPPNFVTCVSLLLPQFQLQVLKQFTSDVHNMTTALKEQWHFLHNLSSDANFTRVFQEKWDQFLVYTDQFMMQGFSEQAMQAYKDLQKTVERKWTEFRESAHKPASGDEETPNDTPNASYISPLDDYMNRTKATVSRLSDTLQDTWEKVKNLSTEFLLKHEDTIRIVQDKVQEKVNRIGEKVHSKLEKVKKKFQKHGLFLNEPNPTPEQKDTCNKQRETTESYGPTTRREHKKESPGFHYDEAFPNDSNGKFEDKPNHRKKESNHEYDNYEEFWNRAEFDPDDFIEDGFFEGNNREWRKHQKRLKKLHGRIHGLNEDILTSMDDDDIEELYDDLEDFEDDVEDEAQTTLKLKTWLTCQLRWWKSRFQRKHRKEDIIKGCGKQLMHWQLRAVCKPKCVGKKCKGNLGKPSLFCTKYLHKDSFNTQDKCQGDKCQTLHQFKGNKKIHQGFHGNNPKTDQKHVHHTSSEKPKYNDRQKPSTPNDRHMKDIRHLKVEEEMVNSTEFDGDSAEWYFKRSQSRDNRVSSSWYFHRMETREDGRHDASWYLKKMYKNHPQNIEDDTEYADDDGPTWKKKLQEWGHAIPGSRALHNFMRNLHQDHAIIRRKHGCRNNDRWNRAAEHMTGYGGQSWRHHENNHNHRNKWACN